MPLERIVSRTESRLTRRRLCGLGGLGAGVALVLSACAQGTSREAERGKELDAERTSVVDNLQATQTARLVLGTPPATPSTPES